MFPWGWETVGLTALVASFTVIPFNAGPAVAFAVGASTIRMGDDDSRLERLADGAVDAAGFSPASFIDTSRTEPEDPPAVVATVVPDFGAAARAC